jgi:6,7-dimethyl-8-ribityllumazine synthase
VNRDIDESSENVVADWSRRVAEAESASGEDHAALILDEDTPGEVSGESAGDEPPLRAEPAGERAGEPAGEPAGEGSEPSTPQAPEPWGRYEPQAEVAVEDDAAAVEEAGGELDDAPMDVMPSHEHAVGDLEIPDGYAVLEGVSDGGRRAVGVVVARFNGAVTSRLLERALEELEEAGVRREAITVMVVPGAFELPLAATALAKTRRFACIVALGCVIRGDTPHFDYVASEAASGLQLAALETGVPVSFGVLTLDRVEQADPRIEKGAEAVRTALEMADVFSHLRAAASR